MKIKIEREALDKMETSLWIQIHKNLVSHETTEAL